MSKQKFWGTLKRFVLRLMAVLFVVLFFLVIYLDGKVRDEFKQQAWSIPAKVYARPLNFSVGQPLSMSALKAELKMLGYRNTIKAVNQGEYEQYDNTLVVKTRAFKFWDGHQDARVIEIQIENDTITRLANFVSGERVSFFRLEPLVLGNINAASNEDRQLVTLEQLPSDFIPALLLTEDRSFYDHYGISIKGIFRALWSNIAAGEVKQGGSTLTQQLMKNHFLTNDRTLSRKIQEAIMAFLTEIHYDKSTILQAYVNEVYLGQDRGRSIHGFGKAAEFYFDRPISKLNLSQVALLVGMIKGPSYYNPRRNPERAKQRRDLVLNLMVNNGLITEAAYQDAINRSLMVVAKPRGKRSKVPAFMSYVKRELQSEYSLSALNEQGLRVFTSLDPLVQAHAEKALKNRLALIEKTSDSIASNTLQGAVLVSDVQSGDILAMVGDRQASYVGFNRALDAYRQTGSVIKPFVYLSALQNNRKFNLLSQIDDQAFTLEGSDGSLWQPKNYDGDEHGAIQLREGLINSYNLATARLALSVGVDEVAQTIVDAGFDRKISAYPSIALGAKEMSPLEVLRLYQVIANQGVAVNSSGILAVQDHNGNLLKRFVRKAERLFDAEEVFMVLHMLTKVVERGTAKSVQSVFPDKIYAGKTGTTNDLRDSWYAGFGAEKLAVVWIGQDSNEPTNLTGATGALPVWIDLFKSLSEPSIELRIPESLVWAKQQSGIFSRFTGCDLSKAVPLFPEQLPEEYEICEP